MRVFGAFVLLIAVLSLAGIAKYHKMLNLMSDDDAVQTEFNMERSG